MGGRGIATSCVASVLALGLASTAVAGVGDGIVGGIVGGIIGGAIVNEGAKNRERQRTVVRREYVPSATRAENAQIQSSLNYFGFPAGTPDGVFGRNTRNAIADFQATLGYPVTGQLTPFERDFLLTSYRRAQAGGPVTQQQMAQNPMGPRGVLIAYRDQAYGGPYGQQPFAAPAPVQQMPQTTIVVVPPAETAPQASTAPVAVAAPAPVAPSSGALPNFLGGDTVQASLNSQCNKVSLMTNTNGGFITAANMTDPALALDEQFCLARTYAIAQGEEMSSRLAGVTPQQIVQQCAGFGPAMQDHISSVSLQNPEQVLAGVGNFILQSGVAPAQLAGTAKICLSAGYRTDDMDVAIGSTLLLVALGEKPYAELLGHHLTKGFGTGRRPDLALAWYDISYQALKSGTPAVFNPGQPERADLIRTASYAASGTTPPDSGAPVPASLPNFSIAK